MTPHLAEEIYWHAHGAPTTTPNKGSGSASAIGGTGAGGTAAATPATAAATPTQSVFTVLRWPNCAAPSGVQADGCWSSQFTNDSLAVVDDAKEREEMDLLMRMRERVLGLLERARGDK